MSPTIDHDDSTQLKEAWIWFFVFGGLEMLVGFVALGYSVLITEVSVVLFGWLLLIGGVLEVGHSLWHRRWKGFFIDLLTGLLRAGGGNDGRRSSRSGGDDTHRSDRGFSAFRWVVPDRGCIRRSAPTLGLALV